MTTMAKSYVLYNPMAANGTGAQKARKLDAILPDREKVYRDITRIGNYAAFFAGMTAGDDVILCGGDGTLNHFINDLGGTEPPCPILYYATGSGNDFLHDLGREEGGAPFAINAYIRDLPVVEVDGRKIRFINGVGTGVDGYCCQRANEIRRRTGKPASYMLVAMGGVLGGFSPVSAAVTVDGVRREFRNAWMVPTMHGRYFGGGMRLTPDQDRTDGDRLESALILHNIGRLRIMHLFPTVYKGTHIRYTDYITVLRGREITVEFDRPMPMQIDGETLTGVKKYTVTR